MADGLVNMAGQFAGLPMKDLIGGPLQAACDAQNMLAAATANFIKDVGMKKNADGSMKETREINGRMYVYETPIHGDLALIRAERGDRWGNLTFRKAARNFGPVMAMAARKTVASIFEKAELGGIDPETVITPGIFVHAVVHIPRVATQAGGIKA